MTIYRRKLPHLERDGSSYFITFKARDDLTLNDDSKWLLLDHCLYDDGKRYELESVVVMSTHVHLILTPLPDGLGYFRLATIMNAIKGASSHSVNRLLKRRGSLWIDESFDHLIRSEEDFEDKTLYIAMNAVETGARSPQEYPWYWRRGMSKRERKQKSKGLWLSRE